MRGVVVLSFVLEAFCWILVFKDNLGVALLAHLTASALFHAASHKLLMRSQGTATLCTLFFTLLPGPGTITGLALLVNVLSRPPSPEPLVPEKDIVHGVPPMVWSVRLGQGPVKTLDREVHPAVEPLLSGTTSERRAALEVVAELGESHHVQMLKEALKDGDREIFQLAHAKLNKLHEFHSRSIKEAQDKPESLRDEAIMNSCLEYVTSGLLGGSTQTYYAQRALEAAKKLEASAGGEKHELIVIQAQLLQILGRPEEALACYQSVGSETDDVDMSWGRAQCLHKLGRRTELMTVLRKLAAGEPRGEVLETVQWYLKGLPSG